LNISSMSQLENLAQLKQLIFSIIKI
jgi:hypothetical protein